MTQGAVALKLLRLFILYERKKANNDMRNSIWKLGPGRIAMYTEDKKIWRKIRRSYSGIVKSMAEYYSIKTGNKPYARQYAAPMRKRATFEKMFGVKMEED